MTRETVAYWRRIAVATLVASAAALFVFGNATFDAPPRQLARNFGIALLFSCCIAPLLGVAMPRLARRVWCRVPFPFNWAAVLALMSVLAIVGTVAAVGLLVGLGIVPAPHFLGWVRNSLRIALAVTLTIGIFVTGYETMRARLAQASAEARLASLESRVHPHFLFNTLNSIAAMVHDDPAGAERMTTKLASLLRSSLDADGDRLVPLDEELRVVRDYLDIEHVRFGDRLAFTVERDASAAGAMVPRLSIQTLVENAVKHAVSPSRARTTITVGARAADHRLRIVVEDDGPGFDSTTLPEGHGLALLRARLDLLFEGTGTLRIDGASGRTSVSMNLPFIPSGARAPESTGMVWKVRSSARREGSRLA